MKETEWHNLEENPSDVPNNKRYVWCYTSDGYEKGFYDKDLTYTKWVIRSSFYSHIIAWCELPTFKR